MNLYLDSSALVKLYVDEEGSPAVQGALQQATVAATLSLDTDWVHYQQVRVTDQLIHKAAETAESFELRAYDAVHLTSALTIAARLETQVVFACWDAGLEQAAGRAGLQVVAR